jgi:anti-sigma-K factor RskA
LDFEIMDYSEDQIALAAEYALGTLDADERAQVESMMALDKEFADMVRAWEFRLGVLNQMVGSIEPRPVVWDNIKRAIGEQMPREPLLLDEAAPPPPSPPPPPPPPELAEVVAAPIVDSSNVVRLSKRARRWRNFASAVTALAAVLVATIGLQLFRPDLLPDALRPPTRTRIVEVKAPPAATPQQPPPAAQYVALLQGQAGGPAFILTVDGGTRNFTVRKLGAPPIDAGKSYELWLISDKLGGRPRSLGVIGASDFTARPLLASYDTDVVTGGTYAVTVEQAGGSPDGAPHSTPVFAGKLIETVPPG